MSDAEKIAKFDELQRWLWDAAEVGNLFQSTMAAALIRQFSIPSPTGEDPEGA